MNRNEKRVLAAMQKGYKIYGRRGEYWLKRVTENGCHVLSGVSANTVSFLHNHYCIDYKMAPDFCYELR